MAHIFTYPLPKDMQGEIEKAQSKIRAFKPRQVLKDVESVTCMSDGIRKIILTRLKNGSIFTSDPNWERYVSPPSTTHFSLIMALEKLGELPKGYYKKFKALVDADSAARHKKGDIERLEMLAKSYGYKLTPPK
jgi:hypothetical protein